MSESNDSYILNQLKEVSKSCTKIENEAPNMKLGYFLFNGVLVQVLVKYLIEKYSFLFFDIVLTLLGHNLNKGRHSVFLKIQKFIMYVSIMIIEE